MRVSLSVFSPTPCPSVLEPKAPPTQSVCPDSHSDKPKSWRVYLDASICLSRSNSTVTVSAKLESLRSLWWVLRGYDGLRVTI